MGTNGNAVIYARYSDQKQQEQSIDAQLRYCRSWAAQRGFRVVGQYCDHAISGRDAEARPQFQAMVRDARKGIFDTVIVWKLDRFSRNRYDSVIYKQKLKSCGVRVMSATEPVGDGAESGIMEAILEAMAEEYSRQLAQNVTRGMRESARNGNSTGGTIPYGYAIREKKLVIVEEEARVVRDIFRLYTSGVGKKEICAQLHESGRRTRSGSDFVVASLTRILGNPKYNGTLVYDDITVEDGCPAIVDAETWAAAQRRSEANRRAPGRAKAKEEYLLAGKAFCGLCGAPMVGESGKSKTGAVHHYYACADKKRKHTCKKRNERKEYLEGYAVDQALKFILAPERLREISEAVAAEYAKGCDKAGIAALEKEIRKLDRQMDDCVEALLRTHVQRAVDKINAKMESLEAQRADLEDALAEAKLSAKHPMSAQAVEQWLTAFCKGDMANQDYRRRIIDTLINAIYVFDDKIVTYFNINGSDRVTHEEMLSSLGESSDFESCGSPEYTLSEPAVIFAAGVLGLICPRFGK